MIASSRIVKALTGALLLSACGGGASVSHPDQDAAFDGGVCGTLDNPGVLQLEGVSPAFGASVINRHIVHGFTVVNAPATNVNFDLKYGPTHSAGLSTPDRPRFQALQSGSDVVYQLTIESWSRVPGHVELIAGGGFTTSKGCAWVFPSPLFSYDVMPDPNIDAGSPFDAGAAHDLGTAGEAGALDQAPAIDTSTGAVDAAELTDVPMQPPLDASGLDGASVEGHAPAVDASLD
jgi:hypothetical protein